MDKELIKRIYCWDLIDKTFFKAKQRIEQNILLKEYSNKVDMRLSKCGINFNVIEFKPQNIEIKYDYIEKSDCLFYIGCYSCKYDYLTGKEIADYFKIEE